MHTQKTQRTQTYNYDGGNILAYSGHKTTPVHVQVYY